MEKNNILIPQTDRYKDSIMSGNAVSLGLFLLVLYRTYHCAIILCNNSVQEKFQFLLWKSEFNRGLALPPCSTVTLSNVKMTLHF